MNVKKPSTLLLISMFIILLLGSCATFQSPKVLEKGEQSLTISTVGLATVGNVSGWFDINAAFRTHVARRLDAGLQVTYNGWNVAAIGDVKYQILTRPYYLAASIGGGIFYGPMFNLIPILQALVIGGTDNFYVGLKLLYNPMPADVRFDNELFYEFPVGGGVVVGWYGLGKKKRVLLEVNVGIVSMGGTESETSTTEIIIPVGVISFGPGMRFTF